jgi:homocysteine S-methyltransferase
MKKGPQLYQGETIGQLINPFSLAVRLKRPLILDGAMGSLLHKNGYEPDPNLWFSHLNIENPVAVKAIHQAYINAGADIITTNTFRTNPQAIKKQNKYTSEDLLKASIEIAKETISDFSILLAGSNPPAEDSYQQERKISHRNLQINHSKHIDLLAENGCNFVLNETQSHSDEIGIICRFCSDNNIPYVVSLYFNNDFRILSGEDIFEVIKFISDYDPLAIGFNCINPELFISFLLKLDTNYNWGFYLNYGLGSITDIKLEAAMIPESVSGIVNVSKRKNVSFIGGCCGSDPEHIKYIKQIIYGNDNP